MTSPPVPIARALADLVTIWRARAAELQPFAPAPALVFLVAARQVEAAIGGAADVGEVFVVEALSAEPGLSTTELRERARAAGVSTASVTRALPLLEAQGVVAFTVAARNRKRWHLRSGTESREVPEKSTGEPVPSLSDKLTGVSAP